MTTLASSDIEFIVVGLLAAVAQGAPVTTHDLDIVHRRTPETVPCGMVGALLGHPSFTASSSAALTVESSAAAQSLRSTLLGAVAMLRLRASADARRLAGGRR